MYYIAAYDTKIKNTVDVYKEEFKAELFDEANDNVKLVELVTNTAAYFKKSDKVNTRTSIQLVVVNENRKILYRAPEDIALINMSSTSEHDVAETIKLFALKAKTDSTLFKSSVDNDVVDEKPSEVPTETTEKPVEDTTKDESTTESKDSEVSTDTKDDEVETEEVVKENTASSTIFKLAIAVVVIGFVAFILF